MKPAVPVLLLAAVLAASLPASPAFAQHSVSGTIGGRTAATPAAAATASPAAASPAAAPVAPAAAGAAANAAAAPAGATALPAADAANAAASAASVASSTASGATPAPATAAQPALAMTLPPLPVTQPPAPSATSSLFSTTLALLFVLALLVGLAWLLKRFGPRNFGGGNNTVRLVGALSVGARERILVVEVGEQWIVVGASPGRMNALATMPRQEVADAAPAPIGLQGANFAEWFKQTIEKRNGK